MGTALAVGPGQKGMAYSGGRPMFRMERQELSSSSGAVCSEDIHWLNIISFRNMYLHMVMYGMRRRKKMFSGLSQLCLTNAVVIAKKAVNKLYNVEGKITRC